MCFSPQRRTIFRHLNCKKCSRNVNFLTCSLPNVHFARAAWIFSTSELQKVLRSWHVLYIFTSKSPFRHSGVQFFDVRTSKSAPGPSVFLTFSLPNVLLATAAYNFSTSELQKVLPECQFFNMFTSKCAFCQSGVNFFDIGTSKSAPKLTCFVHFHFQISFSPQRRAIFHFSSEHLPPHPPL